MSAEPARHLQVVPNPETGEVEEVNPELYQARLALEVLQGKLSGMAAELGKERKKTIRAHYVAAQADTIERIAIYWRDRCCKRPGQVIISPGGKRWKKIEERLSEPLVGREPFTEAELKAAVEGALIDPWLNGTHPRAQGKQYLDATTIFRDAEQVEKLLRRVDGFVERVGVFPSTVLRELAGLDIGLELERCDCGHARLFHVAAPWVEGMAPCKRCDCGDFAQDFRDVQEWSKKITKEANNKGESNE